MVNLFLKGANLFALRSSQSVFNFLILVFFAHIFSDANLANILFLLSIITVSARLAVFGFDVVLLKSYGSTTPAAKTFTASLAGFLMLWVLLAPALVLAPIKALTFPVILWLFLAALQVFQSSTLLALKRPASCFLTGGALSSGFILAGLLGISALGLPVDLPVFISLNIVVLSANALLSHWLIRRITGPLTPPNISSVTTLLTAALPSAVTNGFLYASAQIPLWFLVAFASDAAVVNY